MKTKRVVVTGVGALTPIGNNLKGTTAVYISPDNSYWSFFKLHGGRHLEASLYFMALGNISRYENESDIWIVRIDQNGNTHNINY